MLAKNQYYLMCANHGNFRSVNINMSEPEKLINELNAIDEIIAICHHGMRSFQVCNYLENNGFNKVLNLDGGIDSWAKTIDTDMAQY